MPAKKTPKKSKPTRQQTRLYLSASLVIGLILALIVGLFLIKQNQDVRNQAWVKPKAQIQYKSPRCNSGDTLVPSNTIASEPCFGVNGTNVNAIMYRCRSGSRYNSQRRACSSGRG